MPCRRQTHSPRRVALLRARSSLPLAHRAQTSPNFLLGPNGEMAVFAQDTPGLDAQRPLAAPTSPLSSPQSQSLVLSQTASPATILPTTLPSALPLTTTVTQPPVLALTADIPSTTISSQAPLLLAASSTISTMTVFTSAKMLGASYTTSLPTPTQSTIATLLSSSAVAMSTSSSTSTSATTASSSSSPVSDTAAASTASSAATSEATGSSISSSGTLYIGIALGVIAGVGCLIAFIGWYIRLRRHQNIRKQELAAAVPWGFGRSPSFGAEEKSLGYGLTGDDADTITEAQRHSLTSANPPTSPFRSKFCLSPSPIAYPGSAHMPEQASLGHVPAPAQGAGVSPIDPPSYNNAASLRDSTPAFPPGFGTPVMQLDRPRFLGLQVGEELDVPWQLPLTPVDPLPLPGTTGDRFTSLPTRRSSVNRIQGRDRGWTMDATASGAEGSYTSTAPLVPKRRSRNRPGIGGLWQSNESLGKRSVMSEMSDAERVAQGVLRERLGLRID